MLKLLTPIYRRVGYRPKAEDEHLDILLRTKVVSILPAFGNLKLPGNILVNI